MKLVFTLFLAVLYFTSAQRIRCESFCRFRFCGNLVEGGPRLQVENRALLLGFPNDPLGPIPCMITSTGKPVLLSNVTGGEVKVSKEFSLDSYAPISQYMRRTIEPNFPSNYLSWIFNPGNGRQSLRRLPSRGNQDAFIDQVCVRMPVTSFNVLRRNGSIRKSMTPKGRRACVGFRTQVPKLLVQFKWLSADNYDLTFEEPNGLEIGQQETTQMSPSGGHHIFDVGRRFSCDTELGREQVKYLRTGSIVERGTYTIRVNHLIECSPGARSDYELRVLFRKKVIHEETGTLSGLGDDVLVRTFDIPHM